jgi:hypothetical protein
MLKYLRIAVTALSLTVCALLVALWVRSYWWEDNFAISLKSGGVLRVTSSMGQLCGLWGDTPFYSAPPGQWNVYSNKFKDTVNATTVRTLRSKFRAYEEGLSIELPYWFMVSVGAVITAIPWLPWSKRFSLRTLLIVSTVIAVVLGIVISTASKPPRPMGANF